SAVSAAATAIRAKLGESLNSIEKLNRPLEQATTASLEALQSYTAGLSEMDQGRYVAAMPLFDRAIALDPNFAMAYHMMSVAAYQAGDIAARREYERKAFGLAGRVSEYERNFIAATYYETTGESDKAIDAHRLNIRNYPRFWGFHNTSSEIYNNLGQYEDG